LKNNNRRKKEEKSTSQRPPKTTKTDILPKQLKTTAINQQKRRKRRQPNNQKPHPLFQSDKTQKQTSSLIHQTCLPAGRVFQELSLASNLLLNNLLLRKIPITHNISYASPANPELFNPRIFIPSTSGTTRYPQLKAKRIENRHKKEYTNKRA
jgi:hypothetical protein